MCPPAGTWWSQVRPPSAVLSLELGFPWLWGQPLRGTSLLRASQRDLETHTLHASITVLLVRRSRPLGSLSLTEGAPSPSSPTTEAPRRRLCSSERGGHGVGATPSCRPPIRVRVCQSFLPGPRSLIRIRPQTPSSLTLTFKHRHRKASGKVFCLCWVLVFTSKI